MDLKKDIMMYNDHTKSQMEAKRNGEPIYWNVENLMIDNVPFSYEHYFNVVLTGTILNPRRVAGYTENNIVSELEFRLNGMNISIDNVIFNPPATIVFWSDDTKTVVKAQDEDFDPEKGLAMAISKKVMGNSGNYNNLFKKWVSKYEEKTKWIWK